MLAYCLNKHFRSTSQSLCSLCARNGFWCTKKNDFFTASFLGKSSNVNIMIVRFSFNIYTLLIEINYGTGEVAAAEGVGATGLTA